MDTKPKVLMLTSNDWANTGWRFSKCIESLGFDVSFYKGYKHRFEYPEQGELKQCLQRSGVGDRFFMIKVPELKEEIEKADIIHFIASTYVKTGANLKSKKIVVQHGGSTYRQNFEIVNNTFNPIADAAIIQSPDLLGLGAKNEHLIYYPVDTLLLQPSFSKQGSKLRVGHFPSTPSAKGTKNILEVIRKVQKGALGNKFEYVGIQKPIRDRVSWIDHLNRIRRCDVLIETQSLWQLNRVFGEWGNTALEAAALGKIVITNSLKEKTYTKEYGDSALHIANCSEELENELIKIINFSDEEIIKDKKKTRAWVEEKHSMKPTAKRIWDEVYGEFY